MTHELNTGGDRGYLRIATEEAWATQEQLDAIMSLVKQGRADKGTVSLWGFYGISPSERTTFIRERLLDVGPLRLQAMDRLIGDATAKGATLHTGGKRIGNRGFFYEPSVLSEIPLDAQVMNEEPFGPVALINPYKSEAEMIAEANRLPYGLAAYAWTADGKRQRRLAAEIETGMLGINSHMIGGADAPFGGVRWSGHGSEDGPEGVLACMVLKAVHEG